MKSALKILLPCDGSANALAAVRHALRLAAVTSEYVLVNVQEPASLYEVVVAHDATRLAELRRAAGADLLREAEALLDASGVAYESEVAGGAPGPTLSDLARLYACDAIVIGAQGRDAPPGAATLGPVAQHVLATSRVPVTVVRAAAVDELPEAG